MPHLVTLVVRRKAQDLEENKFIVQDGEIIALLKTHPAVVAMRSEFIPERSIAEVKEKIAQIVESD